MKWWPYFISRSKRSLSRCRLMGHILCKWQLLRHYCEWVWVVLGRWDIILGGWGEWGCMGHYFGRVEVDRKIFWVGGDRWDEWGWVGVGALFDNALRKSIKKFIIWTFGKRSCFTKSSKQNGCYLVLLKVQYRSSHFWIDQKAK